MRKNTLISKIKALQAIKKALYTSVYNALLIQPFYLLAHSIEKGIAYSEIEMLFNINSNSPLYAFITTMVLIYHYSKPPIRFYNSIYKVKYMIEMLTNNAIVPATYYTSYSLRPHKVVYIHCSFIK